MKRILIICYTALFLAFAAPLFLRRLPQYAPDAFTPALPVPAPAGIAAAAAAEELSGSITVLHGGAAEEMDTADYLTGVVAAEMPACFAPEALKAQAVAARTYVMYCAQAGKHDTAQVCTDSGCCQAWLSTDELRERWGKDYGTYYDKVRAAVSATAGEYLAYGGAPVFAAFHSSSAGATEDSGAVWNALPYLISVSSPENAESVPGYVSTLELSRLDFRDSLLSVRPDADLSTEPEKWLGELRRDASGRVETAVIGGKEFAGTELRSLFGLRSTAFTLEYDGELFRFTVTGYGHGVGMSQYGANVMAAGGADYAQILAHYYPGTELVRPVC